MCWRICAASATASIRAWFAPHFEFRFPRIGEITLRGTTLELRHALEPWHVLGEEPAGGGTARFVDSSVERVQALVSGWVDERYVLACNGSAVPLTPTERAGEYVGGVRFKAWQPPVSALHPTHPGADAAGVRHLRPLDRPQPGRADASRVASRRPQLRALPGQRQRSGGAPPGALLPDRPHPGTDDGAVPGTLARTSAHVGLAPRRCDWSAFGMARDEMVDGKGGLRPQWRGLLGVLAGLGHGVLAERASATRSRDGGGGRRQPAAWLAARSVAVRSDPACRCRNAEFSRIEAGLAQRARLLDAVLADIYGPQSLLADGALPPALVFANPGFLRPCRDGAADRPAESAAILRRRPDARARWHMARPGGSHRTCRWPCPRAAEPQATRPRSAGAVRVATALPHRPVRRTSAWT